MTLEDFVIMIKDLKMTHLMTREVCATVFKNIQHSDDSFETLDDDKKLILPEFIEVFFSFFF